MNRFSALGNVLRAKLGRRRELEAAAIEHEVVEPETCEPAPGFFMLPGMLERVTGGVPGHSTAEMALASMRESSVTHAPIIRYVLKDCLVHHGGVEFGGGSLSTTGKVFDRLPVGPLRTEKRASYCMSQLSHVYFGHWLTDACATALLCDASQKACINLRKDWPDTAAYAKGFRLPARAPETCHVSELTVYSDHGQGASKRRRYRELRSRLAQSVGAVELRSHPVYLRRGKTGVPRLIVNEGALCERLSERGFDIVDLATASFSERFKRLSPAPVVVSVEGSHANHAFYAMQSGATLISLIPADRFTYVQYGLTNAFGLRYGLVVTERIEGGCQVNLDYGGLF